MCRVVLQSLVVLIVLSLSVVQGGAAHCTGFIGFSSIGAKSTHSTGLIKFSSNYVDSGHGWVTDTGTFTAMCPGIYQVSFTAYGNPSTRITLQKRPATSARAGWEPLLITPSGGGSASIFVPLKIAEQISISSTGTLHTDIATSTPVTSFSAYKIGD